MSGAALLLCQKLKRVQQLSRGRAAGDLVLKTVVNTALERKKKEKTMTMEERTMTAAESGGGELNSSFKSFVRNPRRRVGVRHSCSKARQ